MPWAAQREFHYETPRSGKLVPSAKILGADRSEVDGAMSHRWSEAPIASIKFANRIWVCSPLYCGTARREASQTRLLRVLASASTRAGALNAQRKKPSHAISRARR